MAIEQEADRITQKYLRRWPDSKRAKSWAGRMVHIQTENGVWRTNGHGYTWADKPDAWVLPFEEAQKCVAHCGPEKQATFIAVTPVSPVSPDATGKCGELVLYNEACEYNYVDGYPYAYMVPHPNGQYVSRSQAEELLAAERAEKERLAGIASEQMARAEKAEADNAALSAKLETANALVACCCGDPVDAHNMGSGHSPVDQYHYAFMQLEAKLAAAQKALEFYANRENWKNGRFEQAEGGTVLRHHPSSVHKDRGAKARAVLGGKPS